MTDEELQAHIKALNDAAARGEIQSRAHYRSEDWFPSMDMMIAPQLYRIKPQPREVFIAIEDIPGPGCGHPNAYVLGAGELSQLPNPQKFRKFREVIE